MGSGAGSFVSGRVNVTDPAASLRRGHASAWPQLRPEFLPFDEVLGWWEEAVASRGTPGSPDAMRLYVHFPFCNPGCRYCSYWHVVPPDAGYVEAYTAYLEWLTRRFHERIGRTSVRNAYFGGGTPSLLSASQLGRVMATVGRTFQVTHDFTCEANPSSLDEDKLRALAAGGVNRLSLGVQSFHPTILDTIGRTGAPVAAVGRQVDVAQRLGMAVNVDLVAGLPGATPADFRQDLRTAMSMHPDSIFAYRYQPVKALPLEPPSEMLLTRLFDAATLAEARESGYALDPDMVLDDRAFCAALFRAPPGGLHIVNYVPQYSLFDDTEAHLLGLGPGAWSHCFGHGWYREVTSPGAGVRRQRATLVGTRMTPADECRTLLLAGLHSGKWFDTSAVASLTGVDPLVTFGSVIDAAVRDGVLERKKSGLPVLRGRSPEFRVAAGARPEGLERLVSALLPAAAPGPPPLPPDLDLDDVQPALVPFALRRDASRGAETAAGAAWRALLGIPEEGEFEHGVKVLSARGGEVRFRVAERAPDLCVLVGWNEDTRRAFFRSRRFAIGYRTREGADLDDVERRFLLMLCKRTARLDP